MVSRWCLLLLAPALLSVVLAEERRAIVILKGDPGVSGNVTFSQLEDDGPVTIRGTISGLSKGKHGFHIHEKGDLTSGCKSTAGHFNPDKKNHGGPSDEVRHAGDLGNIFAEDNGVADVVITDKIISLVGKYSILGRAVVVHSDADDLGRGGFSDTGRDGISRVAKVKTGTGELIRPLQRLYPLEIMASKETKETLNGEENDVTVESTNQDVEKSIQFENKTRSGRQVKIPQRLTLFSSL